MATSSGLPSGGSPPPAHDVTAWPGADVETRPQSRTPIARLGNAACVEFSLNVYPIRPEGKPTLGAAMTPFPWSVGLDAPLERARALIASGEPPALVARRVGISQHVTRRIARELAEADAT